MSRRAAWTIYEIEHVESGRRYVGLTSRGLKARWNAHVHASKRSNLAISTAIREHGPAAFALKSLAQVVSSHGSVQASNLERSFIQHRNAYSPAGFNFPRHLHPIRRQPKSTTPRARLIAGAAELLECLVMVRDADDEAGRDGLPRIPTIARARIDAAIVAALPLA